MPFTGFYFNYIVRKIKKQSTYSQKISQILSGSGRFLEQDTGVEPAFTAWEAVVLPIYESCIVGIIADPKGKFNHFLSAGGDFPARFPFFQIWPSARGQLSQFLDFICSSWLFITTVVQGGMDLVIKALAPMTLLRPMTVLPPRMEALA